RPGPPLRLSRVVVSAGSSGGCRLTRSKLLFSNRLRRTTACQGDRTSQAVRAVRRGPAPSRRHCQYGLSPVRRQGRLLPPTRPDSAAEALSVFLRPPTLPPGILKALALPVPVT